ncbi:Mov34/MPN/PAD-1 family protein [Salinisphaera sp. T31B1]|uniref:Mov34/MPN/PAD-1 family protein n=1 Tax=Salinisphaera sp. T31B1 TaxID=727963 RepID=UPI00333FD47C
MFDEHADAIRAAAVAAYPNEAVFVITDETGCYEVRNVHPSPRESFAIGKKDMAAARAAGLRAIVHSHPDYPACPSEQDMRGQLSTAVPWGIVATNGEAATPITWWGAGTERPSLEGRPFVHGVTDCYSLIRDYYAAERDIDLMEIPRAWLWWQQGGDLYREWFGPAGFVQIAHAEAKPGDVWLTQIRSPVPNHGGILLERGECLHHPMTREGGPVQPKALSRREPINRWLPHIAQDRGGMILRYEGS